MFPNGDLHTRPAGGKLPRLKRLLVIALAGIGDTLMATPILHELREQFPGASIEVLVLWPGARDLLTGNPYVNRVHQHDFIHAPKLASLRYVAGLRAERFDLSLNLHPQGRREYRWIARLIGARERLSHSYENHGWLDDRLVTRSLPQDYTVHCVDNNLRLLGLVGLKPRLSRHEYELHLTDAEHAEAQAMVRTLGLEGRRWLGVHVGSGGTKNLSLRRWPVDHFARLLSLWHGRHPDVPVVLFGGPGEKEAHAEIRKRVGTSFVEPKTSGLRAAAAVLSRAHAFLSVDTVFMHLAAAVRVKHQMVIETPTLNPPVYPRRDDWVLIPNPAVGGRHLEFYRYDGRSIAGTDDEIRRVMAAVSIEAVMRACEEAFGRGDTGFTHRTPG